MKYGSVCSGIEAATVAWHSLGWSPSWFSEIDTFPSAVLAHHYPSVPNVGDMTKYKEWPDGTIDLLVGGTPCQSFSVAGLRKGLDDPRGNLMLTYLAIAERYRPLWLVWENVPGVLSSNGGRDFGTFLGGLAKLGYGFAYRVLDAQHFGVPQRRRRVFVVGYLGDWRRAAAVLFERHSLQGHSPPSRKEREIIAGTLTRSALDGSGACGGDGRDGLMVAHSLRAEGFDASEDGTGRGTPIVPIAFDSTQITSRANRSNPRPGGPCHTLAKGATAPTIAFDCKASGRNGFSAGPVAPTLRAMGHKGSHSNAGGQVAIAFNLRGRDGGAQAEIDNDGLANIRAASGGSSRTYVAHSAVRRLTPRECERLQGFPDDYTLIPYRNKLVPDGPRYKALGNSMAVPVMRWIGARIRLVQDIVGKKAA